MPLGSRRIGLTGSRVIIADNAEELAMSRTREDTGVNEEAVPRLVERNVGPHDRPQLEDPGLRAWLDAILSRHPTVGLAMGLVRNGSLEFFHRHGFADLASNTPVDADTVFRIASVTKLFTAVAVAQLYEQGLVDLDAPAADYLRDVELIPARAGLPPPKVRHLLTHTAGIAEVQHVRDMWHPEAGPFEGRPPILSVGAGEPMPTLAEYYRRGLRVVAEPGTRFAYCNHGYALLGQIVEDVSGMTLRRYFRERIFEPLGMADTELGRSDRVASRVATGYTLGRHGVQAVPDRDWIGAGCGGIYSTARDVARFAAALLGGGANEHGSILRPATLSTMFAPQFQPDSRVPGWGLGFARSEVGAHRLVGHDGILPGFNTTLLVAPDDGLAIIALTNGSAGAVKWMEPEFKTLLCHLLDGPDEVIGSDVPHRPEVWRELCGRYRLPARISDLRERLAIPGGVDVFVRGGRLMIRTAAPISRLYRGLPLQPDDANDPYVFRVDLSDFGQGTLRIVFGRDVVGDAAAIHTDLGGQPVSLIRRPGKRRAAASLDRN